MANPADYKDFGEWLRVETLEKIADAAYCFQQARGHDPEVEVVLGAVLLQAGYRPGRLSEVRPRVVEGWR